MKIFLVRQESTEPNFELIFDNASIQLGDYVLKRGRKSISLGDYSGKELTIKEFKELYKGGNIKPTNKNIFPFQLSAKEGSEANIYMKGDVALSLILKGLFSLPNEMKIRME